MIPPIDIFRLAKLAEKPWLAEPWELELLRNDPKVHEEIKKYKKKISERSGWYEPPKEMENGETDVFQSSGVYEQPKESVSYKGYEVDSNHEWDDVIPKMNDQQYDTTPKGNDQKPNFTPIQNTNSIFTCNGCGRMHLQHQLHTCPSCGKQFCDKCYPHHNCKKQRPIPPPNTHIALDQQEWYNKQPTRCDYCGKMVRADALRKVEGRKLCPDCLIEHTNSAHRRERLTIILAVCAVVIIIIWVFFCLYG